MNVFEKLDIAREVLQAIVFKKRLPLVVGWDLTYRCNLKCKYCGWWEKKAEELGLKDTFSLIEELSSCGTKFITFGGGEPLLREDLGDIIEFCRDKNIYIGLDSNGTLVKEKIRLIKKANEIKLSLDGPSHIHDFIRGQGVHDKVIEAIEICKKEGIKVNIRTVISKCNISHIPYVFKIAKKYKIGIDFQPCDRITSGNMLKNIPLIPDKNEYREVIIYLMEQKRSEQGRFINNSLSGLRHLYHWPNSKRIFCLASLIYCDIQPDGKFFLCCNFPHRERYLVSAKPNFKTAFDNLSLPYPCRQCWCAAMVEFNLMGSFKLDSILQIWGRFVSC